MSQDQSTLLPWSHNTVNANGKVFPLERWRDGISSFLHTVLSGRYDPNRDPILNIGCAVLRLDRKTQRYMIEGMEWNEGPLLTTRGDCPIVHNSRPEVEWGLMRFLRDRQIAGLVIMNGRDEIELWKSPERRSRLHVIRGSYER